MNPTQELDPFLPLRANRAAVRARLLDACDRAGRSPDAVRVVAVTKSVPPETALALARLGERDLGENRLEGLERKAAFLAANGIPVASPERPPDGAAEPAVEAVRWHYLGHVQRNKARRVLRVAHTLHSVDSLRLVETLGRLAAQEGRRPHVFLQVKLTDEANKTGLAPAELPAVLAAAREQTLPVAGLMTMAPLVEGPGAAAAARATFERLAALAGELPGDAFRDGRARLSMGMSDDFELAVAAGSDVVRIGSAFFAGCPREDRAAGTSAESRR